MGSEVNQIGHFSERSLEAHLLGKHIYWVEALNDEGLHGASVHRRNQLY